MSLFSSKRVPFLDNIPPVLSIEFRKARAGYSTPSYYDPYDYSI